MMMWWPLVNEVRGFPTLSGLKKWATFCRWGIADTRMCAHYFRGYPTICDVLRSSCLDKRFSALRPTNDISVA